MMLVDSRNLSETEGVSKKRSGNNRRGGRGGRGGGQGKMSTWIASIYLIPAGD